LFSILWFVIDFTIQRKQGRVTTLWQAVFDKKRYLFFSFLFCLPKKETKKGPPVPVRTGTSFNRPDDTSRTGAGRDYCPFSCLFPDLAIVLL